MNLTYEVEAGGWTSVANLASLLESTVAAALPKREKRSIHVLFTDDAAMRVINKRWRGKDKPTNVLSFPSPRQPVPKGEVAHLGDIVLAWETMNAEAATQGKPLQHHITHLLVHGVLHLLGFDHESDADASKMEARETRILATLGIPDPYAPAPQTT